MKDASVSRPVLADFLAKDDLLEFPVHLSVPADPVASSVVRLPAGRLKLQISTSPLGTTRRVAENFDDFAAGEIFSRHMPAGGRGPSDSGAVLSPAGRRRGGEVLEGDFGWVGVPNFVARLRGAERSGDALRWRGQIGREDPRRARWALQAVARPKSLRT